MTTRFDDDPVIAAHGHGDQAGTEAAAVAVGAAAAGKGLELAVFAPQAVQEGEIDVHGAVVVDQDAELLPLFSRAWSIPPARHAGRTARIIAGCGHGCKHILS